MKKNTESSPLVYIIVLNWNSCEDAIDCVNSCLELTYSNSRILLIDNASADDSESRLREYFPDIEFIQTGANLEYAKGNNLGIRYALKKGAEFVWILNPDVKVEETSLSLLVDVFKENPSVGICGPRIIQGDIEKRIYFDGLSIHPDKGYQTKFNTTEDWFTKASPSLLGVDSVSGCSMLIRKSLLSDIGLIREDFLRYYNDTELSFRARECGWQTVVCRKAIIMHRANVRRINPNTSSIPPYPYVYRDSIFFARIRKKFVLKTVLSSVDSGRIKALFKEGHFMSGLKALLGRLKIALCTLLTPIKPIPGL